MATLGNRSDDDNEKRNSNVRTCAVCWYGMQCEMMNGGESQVRSIDGLGGRGIAGNETRPQACTSKDQTTLRLVAAQRYRRGAWWGLNRS
ncbi:hypothetical protein PISMIDRAFT_687285 [Pisolithus microcarpus 441]|uniref:Uncharacterized protein n=1 Tax=Pisolithus microcarpus 441 TaxID=765257 RepID=A0A0C9YFV9_9AGAM|nr:hypothetical protein PISMIDRAFT_687285 [Pisolithus microcarpus 441]